MASLSRKTARGRSSRKASIEQPLSGLLLGWSKDKSASRSAVGFLPGAKQDPVPPQAQPILLEGDGHLMTIAPTGAGKGVSCIIPALLTHQGAAIVLDPKREITVVTARRRRELGQEVAILDVNGATGLTTGSLNPLDFVDPSDSSGVENAAAIVAALLPYSIDSDRNRFWVSRARQLLLGTILHVASDLPPGERTLTTVRELINRGAFNPSELAQRLSASRHPEARLIEGNLRISAQETLGGIISFAQEGIDFLRGPQVAAATATTSFDLKKIVRGDPITVYIVVPPHQMESLGRVLRLWISVLLGLVMSRRSRPQKSTLFVLDEVAQLGELTELRTAITLLRGFGLQTWTFFQDVSQLRHLYPRDWQTMVNNCKVIQTFGPNNLNAAREMTEIVSFPSAEKFLETSSSEMLLQQAGGDALMVQRPDYRTDEQFAGQFDDNPLFDAGLDPLPVPNPLEGYLGVPASPIDKAAAKVREAVTPGRANPVDQLLATMIFRACLRAD